MKFRNYSRISGERRSVERTSWEEMILQAQQEVEELVRSRRFDLRKKEKASRRNG
jgi:urate oxidase